MLGNIEMIVIGFILLTVGAKFLVKSSSNIAKKYHIPEMLVGLTIVAIGTSMPEIIITITSATKGHADLIIGNAIGSNLCNLLLILGLGCLIYPIKTDKEVRKIHFPVSIISAIILLILANIDNSISRIEGFFLLGIFFTYFAYPIYKETENIVETNRAKNKMSKEEKKINIFLSIIGIVLGIALLKFGGDFVVDNAVDIAHKFNLSERIIGLTIISVGTALPELIITIFAAKNKSMDMAVGNLVGSNVLNLLLIIGLGSLVTPLAFTTDFNVNLLLFVLASTIVWILACCNKDKKLTRLNGIMMIIAFFLYIMKLFII